jgi:hypothetical protein
MASPASVTSASFSMSGKTRKTLKVKNLFDYHMPTAEKPDF